MYIYIYSIYRYTFLTVRIVRGQRWLWVDRTVFTDGALTCDRELGSDIGVRENPIWRMETGVVCIGRGHISADERGRENERSKRVRLTGDRGRPQAYLSMCQQRHMSYLRLFFFKKKE